MIRQIVLLFTILITTLASAQKDYSFDYVAEYKIYDDEYGNGLTDDYCLRYDFINSKDSSYMLYAFINGDTIKLNLTLENGKSYHSEISYNDFFVTHIGLKCPVERRKENSSYKNVKDYLFVPQKDTIINGISFNNFMLKRLKHKEGKVIPDDYYIIDNTAGFNHPVLHPTDILYLKWKKGDNFPNGIIKEVYAYNYKNIRTVFFELVQFSSVEKHIMIDYSGCNN